MLVSTRTALFEVKGTRFSVDTEPTASTLRVSEGRVRATRLSDNLSVEVPAKHRVVASQDHELTPERLPDSISIWESRLERGAKGGNGDWVPAQGGEPAHLRAIPYTIDAKRVLIRLVAQHEVDLLQHLHRLIAIGHAAENISKQPLLPLRQFQNELVR